MTQADGDHSRYYSAAARPTGDSAADIAAQCFRPTNFRSRTTVSGLPSVLVVNARLDWLERKCSMAQRDADFTDYVALNRQKFLRTAFLICGSWPQAEDVTQVALSKL